MRRPPDQARERFTALCSLASFLPPFLPHLGRQSLSVLQPAVRRLGLPAGFALPEQVLLDGQGRVRDRLEPVGFGCKLKSSRMRRLYRDSLPRKKEKSTRANPRVGEEYTGHGGVV